MVKLTAIKKSYTVGDNKVEALKGIDLQFRRGEFVSILGPSGCGKTTMLNIIGGLDRYDSGDIEVNGVSTKAFKAADWDAYRNHSVGFVFQSYNLIGHQTVLANVELALTLAGVSKTERRRKSKEALKKVGLETEIKKKPNQLSGGQMQRVAIARALINDPEIILADEPTGALDSETSKQVMEILKEVAKERLVIMVTHNGELAEEYSTRIIRLMDGVVLSDSNPCNLAQYSTGTVKQATEKKAKKKSMSLKTAFTLSLNNLFTKKGRTILTSFAGSIGIIGIALILSMSSGFQGYIDRVQQETLSTYPLTIPSSTMSGGMSFMFTDEDGNEFKRPPNTVCSSTTMANLYNSVNKSMHVNDLAALKEYIESDGCIINDKDVATVQYNYGLTLNFYCEDTSDGVIKADTVEVVDTIYKEIIGMSYSDLTKQISNMMGGALCGLSGSSMDMWCELIDNQPLLDSQYDLLKGRWPENYNEVVLRVSENYQISEFVEFGMNLRTREELDDLLKQVKDKNKKGDIEYERRVYTYDELLNTKFKLVLNSALYEKDSKGNWTNQSNNASFMKNAVDNGVEIKIVGIIRPSDDSVAQSMTGVLGYSHDLVKYIIDETNESEVVKAQMENPDMDITTGKPFVKQEKPSVNTPNTNINPEEMAGALAAQLNLNDNQTAQLKKIITSDDINDWINFIIMLDQETAKAFGAIMNNMSAAAETTEASYDENMKLFGSVDFDTPISINLYPVDFEAKDVIKSEIDEFNKGKAEEEQIMYTDILEVMLSSVSTIINAISYVLIAFVSISLIVSSIMIGVITYISVLERTKEIGILRAMGASKRDIARVFNAETLIVGFVAGALGIGATILLNIPVNIIINSIAEIGNISKLPVMGGIILVAISMFLTFVAGLIPSRIAAKKDPVVALRTE